MEESAFRVLDEVFLQQVTLSRSSEISWSVAPHKGVLSQDPENAEKKTIGMVDPLGKWSRNGTEGWRSKFRDGLMLKKEPESDGQFSLGVRTRSQNCFHLQISCYIHCEYFPSLVLTVFFSSYFFRGKDGVDPWTETWSISQVKLSFMFIYDITATWRQFFFRSLGFDRNGFAWRCLKIAMCFYWKPWLGRSHDFSQPPGC